MTEEVEVLPLGAASLKQQRVVDAFQKVQVLVIGGAMGGGKSYLMTLLSAMLMDDPNTMVGFYRESLPQLEGPGGLIDTTKKIYSQLEDNIPHKWNKKPNMLTVTGGPGAGARIEYRGIATDKDTENARGLQYTLIGIDEATAFSQYSIEFLMSRLRSDSKHFSRMILSCNPDPDHYLCDMIKDYYLDEEGYPIDERAGDIRYFYRHDGEYYWGDTREEIAEQFDIPEKDMEAKIMSFSFVGVTIRDNPPVLASNPGYLAFLEGLGKIERARNLDGNWFARPEEEGAFKRQWLRGEKGELVKRIKDVPKGCVAYRGVDKAHEMPSETNPDPDYTALSPLILKDRNGQYWLLGNYVDELTYKPYKKSEYPTVGRVKLRSGERDNMIAAQLRSDIDGASSWGYSEPKLVLAKDSGAGGGDFRGTLAVMAENGVKVMKDFSPSNTPGKKMKDFLGFTSAAENGLVYIVEETFDPKSLELYYQELEKFTGGKGTRQHDDWVDATSMAFNACASGKRPYQTLVRNQKRVKTLTSEHFNK